MHYEVIGSWVSRKLDWPPLRLALRDLCSWSLSRYLLLYCAMSCWSFRSYHWHRQELLSSSAEGQFCLSLATGHRRLPWSYSEIARAKWSYFLAGRYLGNYAHWQGGYGLIWESFLCLWWGRLGLLLVKGTCLIGTGRGRHRLHAGRYW